MAAGCIVVVGAGVVGLSAAISLAEAGLSTRVVAAEPPSRVTSVAAGAIWGPGRGGPGARGRGRGGAAGGAPAAVDGPAGRPADAGRGRAAGRVLVRLVLHRARRQHAGLPAVPARPVREQGREGRVRHGAVAGVGGRAGRRELLRDWRWVAVAGGGGGAGARAGRVFLEPGDRRVLP